MNSNFKINTSLALFDYLAMVNEIALEFFDKDGVYQPHIGKINAMRLFYNNCVEKSPYDEKYVHDIVDASDMVDIVADVDFIYEYNEVITADRCVMLDFGNAYKDAMDIVKAKKSSLGNAVEIVGSMMNRLAEKVSSVLTNDNIEKVSKIAKEISEGKISAETIADAYGKYIVGEKDNSERRVVAV